MHVPALHVIAFSVSFVGEKCQTGSNRRTWFIYKHVCIGAVTDMYLYFCDKESSQTH